MTAIPCKYRGIISSKGNLIRQSLLLIMIALSAKTAAAAKRVNTTTGNTADRVQPKVPSDLVVPKEWQDLLNPESTEFWNEGSFKPDAGFVLWAKNPTLENAKLYLIRMNAKRDRLHIMQRQQEQANQELVKMGAIANDYDFLGGATKVDTSGPLASMNDTQIFFLFTPTCQHCKRQAKILAGQANVTPMQVGGTELLHFPNLPQSIWATKEDIDRYVSDKVVPVLLVYNRKTNNMASVKGVHTLREVDQIAKHLRKGEPKHE